MFSLSKEKRSGAKGLHIIPCTVLNVESFTKLHHPLFSRLNVSHFYILWHWNSFMHIHVIRQWWDLLVRKHQMSNSDACSRVHRGAVEKSEGGKRTASFYCKAHCKGFSWKSLWTGWGRPDSTLCPLLLSPEKTRHPNPSSGKSICQSVCGARLSAANPPFRGVLDADSWGQLLLPVQFSLHSVIHFTVPLIPALWAIHTPRVESERPSLSLTV